MQFSPEAAYWHSTAAILGTLVPNPVLVAIVQWIREVRGAARKIPGVPGRTDVPNSAGVPRLPPRFSVTVQFTIVSILVNWPKPEG
jgi:hypothetical protein